MAGKKKLDKASSKATLKRILTYIQRYRLSVAASILLATLTVVLTLYVPVLIGRAVDLILEPGRVDYAGLLEILKKIGIIVLVTAIAQWLMNHINNVITYKVVKDIRTRAFNHLEVLPLSYLDRHPAGDLVSRIIADIDQFSEGLLMGFTQLFTGVMTIIGTLLFMLSINFWITLVVVVITPVSFLVASFIASKTFAMFQKQSQARGELTSLIDENLGNLKVVQAFSQQKEAQAKQRKRQNDLKKTEERIAVLEERDGEIDALMMEVEVYTNSVKCQELAAEKAAIASELEELYEQWEELAE